MRRTLRKATFPGKASYLLTDGEPRTFEVRTGGEIVSASADGAALEFRDQVVRNDLELSKKSESDNAGLMVPFAIENAATGETHVLVTDRNGDASTASSWNKHSRDTNANDALLGHEGPIAVADMDPKAGIWFSLGEDGSSAPVDDSLAALPYGAYTMTELRCDANEGLELITRSFWIDRDSTVAKAVWMGLDDQEGPRISTTAKDGADGDKDVSVTEYTMSEIIASIYAKMEATGLSEGILFIDEINCVSETLAPTMLQFLQCKTFGNQAVPAGWVIVAAGNPPEYNKSVRDFDIVTLDRVRRMDIEPDLPVWKDYARAAHIHSAILSYLELHPQNFYQINADVDGTQFVTARGWEDLSNLLDTYEALGLQADEELIREYIQHPKIAEDFSAYLDLYYKYRDDYGVEEILAGQTKPAVFARLLQAPFDERLSLVSLLLAGLDTRFTASLQADAVADACYAFLRETKKALATLPEDIPDGSAELFSQQIKDYEAETQQKRDAGLLGKAELTNRLQVQAALHQWEGELRRANAAGTQEAFDLLRGQFRALADQREAAQKTAAAALEAAFDFMEQAFAESQEMVVFVTELTVNPASHQFLTENGCERYFKYNKDLLLDHRKAALQQELAAEQRRHGRV